MQATLVGSNCWYDACLSYPWPDPRDPLTTADCGPSTGSQLRLAVSGKAPLGASAHDAHTCSAKSIRKTLYVLRALIVMSTDACKRTAWEHPSTCRCDPRCLRFGQRSGHERPTADPHQLRPSAQRWPPARGHAAAKIPLLAELANSTLSSRHEANKDPQVLAGASATKPTSRHNDPHELRARCLLPCCLPHWLPMSTASHFSGLSRTLANFLAAPNKGDKWRSMRMPLARTATSSAHRLGMPPSCHVWCNRRPIGSARTTR